MPRRKQSDTEAKMIAHINRRLSRAEAEQFAARYPRFGEALADNIVREKNAWLAGGMDPQAADQAAVALWERGIHAGHVEIGVEAFRRYCTPVDIGWVTRRNNQEKAAKAAKAAARAARKGATA